MEDIDRALEQRIESEQTLKELDAVCEEIRPRIKVDEGHIQSIKTRSLVYCGTSPFAGSREGERTGGLVTYIGFKVHVDHDWPGPFHPDFEHTANVLLATRVNIWIKDGRLAHDVKTSIADIITSANDFFGLGNKERQLTKSLQDAVKEHLDKRVRDEVDTVLKNKFGAVPLKAIRISDAGVAVDVGVANPTTQSSAVKYSTKTIPLVHHTDYLGCKSSDESVLRVTFYRENMLLHAATRGKEGVGPETFMNRGVQGKPVWDHGGEEDPSQIIGYEIDGVIIAPDRVNYWEDTEHEHREDVATPGRHRITLYLGDGYVAEDLAKVPQLQLGRGWNDHIGIVIVEAGPKWSQNSLFLSEDKLIKEKGKRLDGVELSKPGITCLDLDPFFFTNKATGLSVTKSKQMK